MLGPLLDTIAPHRCLGCGARGVVPWCPACAAEADGLRVRRSCPRCGSGKSGRHPCWSDPAPIDATRVVFGYRGVVAATVVAAKVRGAAAAWSALGGILGEVVHDLHPDVVTWVPADRERRRRRGFDHARSMAGPVAARLDVACVPLLQARPGRVDQATRPVGERRRVPLGAFRPRGRLTGAVVLLVDDVLTTGATAWAAAAALRRGGADAVTFAAFARAGDRALGPADGRSEPPHPEHPQC